MLWLWISVGGLLGVLVVVPLAVHAFLVSNFMSVITRIFQEKPLFMAPIGKPVAGAEEVVLTTPDGLRLHGCYWPAAKPRKGVVLRADKPMPVSQENVVEDPLFFEVTL